MLRLAAIVLFASALAARADTLWTLDGHVYDGDARLLPSGDLLISQRAASPVQVPLTNVLYATINAPAAHAAAGIETGSLTPHVIGEAERDGDVTFTRGFYALRGGGTGVTGAADGCRFVSKGFYGNGELTVHLLDLAAGEAGLMFRDEMDANAIEVSAIADASGKLTLRYRAEAGKKTVQIDAGKVTTPVWLSLKRAGRQFTASTSADGKKWDLAARLYSDDKPADANAPPQGVDMDTGTLVGLVLTGDKGAAPATAMFETFAARGLYDSVATVTPKAASAQFSGAAPESLRAGILLRTGTFLAKATIEGPEGEKRFAVARGAEKMTVEAGDITAVRLRDVPAAVAARRPEGASGVLLTSGDFMEGDITRFDHDTVEVSNITLGLTAYKLDAKVAGVYFRDVNATPAGMRVRLSDGSLFVAKGMRVERSANVVIEDYVLGAVTVPVGELYAVQNAAERVTTLQSLVPVRVEGPAGAVIEVMNVGDGMGGFWLTAAGGAVIEQGLVMPAGASVTYKLPAGAKDLRVRAAVPERMPAKAAVVFVVLADEKEVYRSKAVTSGDGAEMVRAVVGGARMVTLRVEGVVKELPSYGVWGNGMVMR